MPYLISYAPYVLSLILFSLIGHILLLEKKRVLSILCLLCALLGIWLGSYGKELEATQYVIPVSLIVLSLFLILRVEFTMVGFALMAIVVGFFNGHDMGQDLKYEDSLLPFIGYLVGGSILLLVVLDQIKTFMTQQYALYILGGLSCLAGILLFVFGQSI